MLRFIHKILDPVVVWPSSKAEHFKVEKIGTKDNKLDYYTAIMHKSEVELWRLAKNLNLNERQVIKLEEAIEAYGEYQYEKGCQDIHEQNAGADL
jgi:hypothetical protein